MPKELVRLSNEEIAILISNLPNKAARDELITGHLRLAKHLACKTYRRYGGEKNDLLGAATLKLVECVDRLVSGEKVMLDGNISRWLACRMIGAIKTELYNRAVIRIPASTSFRRAAKGEAVKLKYQELSDSTLGHALIQNNSDIEEYDRLEEARSILKSDLEHRVFDLRYQGLSDNEIGDLLGMNPRSILRIRSEIGKRFSESKDE